MYSIPSICNVCCVLCVYVFTISRVFAVDKRQRALSSCASGCFQFRNVGLKGKCVWTWNAYDSFINSITYLCTLSADPLTAYCDVHVQCIEYIRWRYWKCVPISNENKNNKNNSAKVVPETTNHTCVSFLMGICANNHRSQNLTVDRMK